MVRGNLLNAIANIKWNLNRNMSIRIKTSNKTNIRIINTYARHMGYNKGGRVKFWKDINKIMRNINKNDCLYGVPIIMTILATMATRTLRNISENGDVVAKLQLEMAQN